MIIADTCLVVHLFNQTTLTEKAQKIRNMDPYWILPPLWKEEYANVLSKLVRKEDRAIDEIIHHFNYTLEELKNCEITVDDEKALRISIEYKISVYDAHFVVLAIDHKTVLVTEDKEILSKCSGIALSMHHFLNSLKA